jgi:hypothetical protein
MEAAPARATATNAVSSNWAGYAVTGAKYRRVTGTWTVPGGSCTAGRPSSSAAWVGLGGFAPESQAIEQTGTQFECTSSGRASYSAWYELLPAAPVTIPVTVGAGDKVSASVTVSGTHVAVVLKNRTTGERFAKTLQMSAPDLSSAEWIVEAPSACTRDGGCAVVPLNDFGTTRFSRAHATSTGGHVGTPGDPAWTATVLTLSTAASDGSVSTGPGASAIPSGLTSLGSSFSVTYQSSAVFRNVAKRTFPSRSTR